MKTLNEIMTAVIATVEANNINTKKAIAEAVSNEVKNAGYEPALCRLIDWHFSEFCRRTLNSVENGAANFLPVIKPELAAYGKGYFSAAVMKKAEKPATVANTVGSKSSKIDNTLFCGMLKALMDKAPSEGGYTDKDLPILKKLHDALSTNAYSVAKIKDISAAKVENASDAKSKKTAQHEHEIRTAVITLIESELERFAKEAAQKQLNEVLDLL